MSVYRFCWGGLVLPLAGFGMVVAVLALPPGDVLLRVGAGLVVGPAGVLLVRELLEACDMAAPRPPRAALAGAVSLVAAAGVRVVVGEGAMLLLAVLVVLSSPVVVRCCAVVLRARLLSALASDPDRVLPPGVLALLIPPPGRSDRGPA